MFAQLEDEPAQLPLGTAFPTVTVCTYRFGGEVNLALFRGKASLRPESLRLMYLPAAVGLPARG